MPNMVVAALLFAHPKPAFIRLSVLHGNRFHPKLRLTPGFELHSSVAADGLGAVDSLA